MDKIHCFSCQGLVPEMDGPTHDYILAAPGCWHLYSTLLAQRYENPAAYGPPGLLVDTYAVQHPGVPEDRRARQSVHVHLVALYLALEKDYGRAPIMSHMQAILERRRDFPWLEPPDFSGVLDVSDVAQAAAPEEHRARVREWAEAVWRAWSPHHPAIHALAP
jgi:hypothetical protein